MEQGVLFCRKKYLSDFFLFAREDYMMFLFTMDVGWFRVKKIKNSRDLDNFLFKI